MTADDIHRREARATFHRAVAYIANLVEARNAHETDKPYSILLADPEVLADLAIMGTLGPPRAEGEPGPLDEEEMTEEQVEAVPAEQFPSVYRDLKVTAIAGEILRECERYSVEHPDEKGFALDREVRACQSAVHVNYQKYGDGPPSQQESWDLVASYLSNHDDGFWMLTEPDDDDDDDTEDGDA